MENARIQPPLILASQSPRRRYLLEKAGISVTVIPSSVDESAIQATSPEQMVRLLAEAKAGEIAAAHRNSWVIGADTVVVSDGRVMGKPDSIADARRMLSRLSGQIHTVMTGFCIRCEERNRIHSDTVTTAVEFKQLATEEIEWYIHTGEPFDKAGAYAIQGLGTFLVKSITGSYTNVVGLPVCEVIEFLIHEGIVKYPDVTDRSNPFG